MGSCCGLMTLLSKRLERVNQYGTGVDVRYQIVLIISEDFTLFDSRTTVLDFHKGVSLSLFLFPGLDVLSMIAPLF